MDIGVTALVGRPVWRAITLVCTMALAPAVWAETPDPTPAAEPKTVEGDDTAKTLLGDMGGLRSTVAPLGLTFNISETSEVLGNVSGGMRRGVVYEGLTDFSLQWDLRPHFRWPGVFFARGLQIHGRGLSANDLGNLITVSSIEANPASRLFELWYEHYANDWLRIRIGQQAADQEFIVSTTSKLFVNSTFGFPTLPAADLPSGGPAYPLGTPAVRLRIEPAEGFVLLAGVFNGDPAGPGLGAAQLRDSSGTSFRTGDGVLALFEARYNPGNSDDNGTYKLGAWFNSNRFPDQRFDGNGVSLASPLSSGMPRLLGNNYSVYGILDQPIYIDKERGQSLTGFIRAMGAPGDRNLVSFYFDTGLAFKGPFGRKDDTVGIGFGYAQIGSAARSLDQDNGATVLGYPVRSREAVLEVTYQVQVTDWWQLQPDFQYVVAPGGGIPNPNAPDRKIGNAAVLGLRSAITF
jgi:porin